MTEPTPSDQQPKVTPTRRDRLRPLELVGFSGVLAVFAGIVVLVDRAVDWPPVLRLLMLVSVGAATYGAMLLVVARPLVRETVALVRNRV